MTCGWDVYAVARIVRAFYRRAHSGRAQLKIKEELPKLSNRSKSRQALQIEGSR